ncbi:MAG TPA: ABC transporter permease [Acidimicrobiales bacterium]|nr:ABC transporter permease [Acidimicrobiales bacterium]
MVRFAVRRILQGFVVIFGVTTVVFVVTRLIGDPVRMMLPMEATNEERDAFARELGFDRPIPTQFVDFLGDLVRFDFGDSLWQRRPALDIVLEHLPRTFSLVGAGMGLAIVLSLAMGLASALRPGSLLDRIMVTTSLAGLSIPEFWLGLLLIMVFGVQLGWFPTSGTGSFGHMVLPTVTLALPIAGRLAMMVRSTMIDELNRQWVRTARAKGMPFRRTVGVHALRNAAVPVVTLAGWELIRALAGYAVVVETVFAWPGIGFLALQAVSRQDLMLLQAIVFVVAVLVVVVNVAIDVAYKAIDPRIELT